MTGYMIQILVRYRDISASTLVLYVKQMGFVGPSWKTRDVFFWYSVMKWPWSQGTLDSPGLIHTPRRTVTKLISSPLFGHSATDWNEIVTKGSEMFREEVTAIGCDFSSMRGNCACGSLKRVDVEELWRTWCMWCLWWERKRVFGRAVDKGSMAKER